ncbi:MAG: hypothetical protein CSA33_06105 [Desulfobulbus propionicus]|nr:MAG: hypothetical protein CSA33_06105 [Desulfobulbus propionicus]
MYANGFGKKSIDYSLLGFLRCYDIALPKAEGYRQVLKTSSHLLNKLKPCLMWHGLLSDPQIDSGTATLKRA